MLSNNDYLKKRIRRLLKERNAILLAHNYQRDEIQGIADICGDSLGLSQEAAKTDREVIVFCGVHFMAENASILSPDKIVLLPNLYAGCPLADMITVKNLRQKKAEYPEVSVVCYVNSSAAVKAESDICCTSANAVRVINTLNDSKSILMIPDMNLSYYAAKFTGRDIIPWKGFCPTHHRIKVEDVMRMREKHPSAKLVVHPECTPDVVALADHVCSTSGMYQYAHETDAEEFIIGTEMGILYRLRLENPDKRFYLVSDNLICNNMKVTVLEDVVSALENMTNIIKVPEHIRIPAKKALDRMLQVPRDKYTQRQK